MEMKKRLLMVDDDFATTDTLPRMFARRGIALVVVGSVAEALEQHQKSKFDLIVTDIVLNGPQNGIDLVRELRKTDKQIKIVVSTGFGEERLKEAMAAGANFFFEKPLDLQKHIFAPLGMGTDPGQERSEAVADEKERSTLRKTLHEIGNKNNCVILVSSLLKETIDTFAREERLSVSTKTILERAADDLADIEAAGQAADALLKKVRSAVYDKLNPDEVVVE